MSSHHKAKTTNSNCLAASVRIRLARWARLDGLLAAIFIALLGDTRAATVTAKSVSLADVRSAIDSAHEGDTVVVPPGTASWASMLTITKGITLQGAGNDLTIVLDNNPEHRGLPPGQRRTEGPEQRQPEARVEQQQQQQRQPQQRGKWQLQRPGRAPLFAGSRSLPGQGTRPGGGPNGGIMKIELKPHQSFRLTGITLRFGSLTTRSEAAIRLTGTCPSVRVDHCHFDQLYGRVIETHGWLYGVIDHCTFDIRREGGAIASVNHNAWGNQSSGWGSWADPPYFGSDKFIFFEDNIVTNHSAIPNRGSIDAAMGGRYVARHNIFNNCNIFYHGTDTGAGGAYYRGTRAVEIYKNTFNSSLPNHAAGQCRSGALLWHDNTYTGTFKGGMVLKIYRQFQGGASHKPGGWGAANGTNPWDCNATEQDGTHVDGHAPYTFATGTHIGGNDSTAVTVSGTPWKPNQWAGYSIANTSRNSPYFNGCSYISSNTSNTLTLAPFMDIPPLPKFNSGDTFAIHKVLIVLDQPGRGKGDLLRGSGPTPAWPHQASEPCYSWNNTLNGSKLDFSNKDSQNILREKVDYYNSTPMPGYTPYTYPHPLTVVSGKP